MGMEPFLPSAASLDPKPIILCLHGGGTNSRIFTVQTARIRRALAQQFNFIFLDGPVQAPPGPGVLPFYEGFDPYLRWVPRDLSFHSSEQRAVEVKKIEKELDRNIDEQLAKMDLPEKIVGVMGFSAGGAMAYELLHRKQRLLLGTEKHQGGNKAWQDLQFGIHINPVMAPWGGLREERLVKVSLPTVHVHGLQDKEWVPKSKEFTMKYFKEGTVKVLELGTGHHMPHEDADMKTLVQGIIEVSKTAKMYQ